MHTVPVGSVTGLVLSISYQIVVEKHQGELSRVSTPGEGTEFIVKIPMLTECVGCSVNFVFILLILGFMFN